MIEDSRLEEKLIMQDMQLDQDWKEIDGTMCVVKDPTSIFAVVCYCLPCVCVCVFDVCKILTSLTDSRTPSGHAIYGA